MVPRRPPLRRARPPHPFRADPSHRFALIGIYVEQLTRDRRLDYSSGHHRRVLHLRQYVVFDVDTTQLCTFFVYTSEHQEVKVALDPLVLKDVGAPLLVVGDWRVLPGQPSIHRRPGEFVCQCLQTSSHAPCHSCFGGSSGEDHFLVSDFTASHSVPEAAASAAALGPVPDELAESAPSDGVDAHDFPEVSETPEVSGLGSSPGAGASGTSGASAGSGASDCEAGHAFASTLALSSSPPCHLSLLFLGPSVDSGGGRPSKRFRELDPLGRPREGSDRAVLCGCPGCSCVELTGVTTGAALACGMRSPAVLAPVEAVSPWRRRFPPELPSGRISPPRVFPVLTRDALSLPLLIP